MSSITKTINLRVDQVAFLLKQLTAQVESSSQVSNEKFLAMEILKKLKGRNADFSPQPERNVI